MAPFLCVRATRRVSAYATMKNVSDKEYAAVIALPGPQRYEHFVRQVADFRELWSLKAAPGWVLLGDAEGNECVPIWPHSRYAQACAVVDWDGAEATAIPLDRWIEKWTPGMIRDGRKVAVFPTVSDRAVVVTPQRLHDDLQAELAQYDE